jgi:hypothetical protein
MSFRACSLCLIIYTGAFGAAGCGQSEKGELAADTETAKHPTSPTNAAPPPLQPNENEGKGTEATPPSGAGEKKERDVEHKPKTRSTTQPPSADTLELIEAVLGKQSDDYQASGHSGLTFDETKDSLAEKKLLVGRKPNSELFALKDNREVQFTASGKLVGILLLHSEGDNERSSAKLIDLFGKPEPENVEKFASEGSTRSSSILRVTYLCPNVLVSIRYVFETSIEFNNTVRKTQRTFLAIYDRRWVIEELAAHIEHQRKAMTWLTEVVEAGRPPGTELGKLPVWPATKIEAKNSAIWSSYYWVPTKAKEDEVDENSKNQGQNWMAALTTQSAKTPDHPKGTVTAMLRIPSERRTLLEKSNLAYLLTRANSRLAQELFPPRADTITVNSIGTAKSFEWLTKEYLIVQVKADNTLVVARRPN